MLKVDDSVLRLWLCARIVRGATDDCDLWITSASQRMSTAFKAACVLSLGSVLQTSLDTDSIAFKYVLSSLMASSIVQRLFVTLCVPRLAVE